MFSHGLPLSNRVHTSITRTRSSTISFNVRSTSIRRVWPGAAAALALPGQAAVDQHILDIDDLQIAAVAAAATAARIRRSLCPLSWQTGRATAPFSAGRLRAWTGSVVGSVSCVRTLSCRLRLPHVSSSRSCKPPGIWWHDMQAPPALMALVISGIVRS